MDQGTSFVESGEPMPPSQMTKKSYLQIGSQFVQHAGGPTVLH